MHSYISTLSGTLGSMQVRIRLLTSMHPTHCKCRYVHHLNIHHPYCGDIQSKVKARLLSIGTLDNVKKRHTKWRNAYPLSTQALILLVFIVAGARISYRRGYTGFPPKRARRLLIDAGTRFSLLTQVHIISKQTRIFSFLPLSTTGTHSFLYQRRYADFSSRTACRFLVNTSALMQALHVHSIQELHFLFTAGAVRPLNAVDS
jgi:hypothetical protein